MFKNPFSFEGRIRRTEYCLTYVVCLGIMFILSIFLRIINSRGSGFVLIIFYIPLIWFIIAQRAKRCHDLGNSGWFQLIPFYSLWMLIADSDHGYNAYGANPKGKGNSNSINEIGQKEI